MAAILTLGGRVAIAEAIRASTAVHMAWGNGDVSWGTTPPAPSTTATALLVEIGRRQATEVSFCSADAAEFTAALAAGLLDDIYTLS